MNNLDPFVMSSAARQNIAHETCRLLCQAAAAAGVAYAQLGQAVMTPTPGIP